MTTDKGASEMSEAKHTPGPWSANCAGIETRYYKLMRLCTLTGPHFVAGELGNAVSDSKLISAAPDLLEALRPELLEQAAAHIDSLVGGDNAMSANLYMLADLATAAIERATS